jgi:multicomponent Na+:H+ antiporter subunit A
MLTILLVGFIASFAAPAIYRRTGEYFGWIAASYPLFLFLYFLSRYTEISNGTIVKESAEWFSALGINATFVLDGLSLTFVLIITLIGAAVFLYAGNYMKKRADTGRFYVSIGIFMTSMIGVVLSDNMIVMFVFWELTSVSSYLLIGFHHDREESRKAALQALLVTGGGGLALLAGMMLLAQISGSYELSSLYHLNNQIAAHPLYAGIVVLVLLGAFTKSAQVPFHFWLPNAMEAPTPVSAYLHSATMVKAGIYLIARMNHPMGGTALWQDSILVVGATTMVVGAVLTFKQTDLKRLLAYSTLSVLGTLTMLLGIGSALAVKAFFIYLVAHSLYKGTLFLVAGIIDHETGTRDIMNTGGLKKHLPITAAISLFASLSMMGIIPLIGFIGKETVYASLLEVDHICGFLLAAAVLANMFIVMTTILAGIKPFFGAPRQTPKDPHEPPAAMWLGPAVLAVLGLLTGLFPNFFLQSLLDRSTISILSEESGLQIHLWHGFNFVLLLSFVTLLLGAALYYFRNSVPDSVRNFAPAPLLTPSGWYDSGLNGMLAFARLQTRILQNGYLRIYIMFIVITTVGLGAYALYGIEFSPKMFADTTVTTYEVILAVMIFGSVFILIKAPSRMMAIVALGVIGYSIAVIYIINGAPDLAMTTFAIETLTIFLFILVLYKLPKFFRLTTTADKVRDAVVAVALGLFMTATILVVSANELHSDLKQYFAETSYTAAKGKNIVNVILVDFRALDTMGEITVLGIAAIGVYALLKLVHKKGDR